MAYGGEGIIPRGEAREGDVDGGVDGVAVLFSSLGCLPESETWTAASVEQARVDLVCQQITKKISRGLQDQDKEDGTRERAWSRRYLPELTKFAGGGGGVASLRVRSLGAYWLGFLRAFGAGIVGFIWGRGLGRIASKS